MARHEEYLWKDPFDPLSLGPVLLSDQIHFLADEVGVIDPFDEKYLRPAAYDLCVGNSYYVDDARKDLTEEASEIEIPPNGLVYVKTKKGSTSHTIWLRAIAFACSRYTVDF